MNFLPVFFHHYFVLVFTLLFFYTLGHFLFFLFRNYFSIKGSYLNCFTKIFLGLISFVTAYSIIRSHFKTVNLCLLVIFAMLFYEIKKRFDVIPASAPSEKKLMWKNIFEFLVVAFLLCGWESVFLLTNNNFPYVIPHFDHTDYSTISQFLNLTGEENAFRESNFYDEAFTGLIPYHYFELWLNAAIAKCFGLLYSTSLLLITYPLFYFLFYLGVNAIWEEFGTISFYKKILSFLFLFFGAFCFPFFEKLPFINQYFYGLVIKSYPVEFLAKKMICIYIFIIPAFLCMVRKYFSTGFLFILCIPVVFAATAPGILAGSFIFLLLVYFLKLISPREIKKTFLYLFVFSVFFFLLYKTSGNHVFLTVEGNIFDLFTTENSALKKQWADVVWLAQTLPFQIILAYLPFIIIFFLFLFSGNKIKMFSEFRSIALIVFVTIIAGGITWAVLLPIPDSFQFYSSVMTFLNMLCIFILVKIFSTQEVKPSGRKIV